MKTNLLTKLDLLNIKTALDDLRGVLNYQISNIDDDKEKEVSVKTLKIYDKLSDKIDIILEDK